MRRVKGRREMLTIEDIGNEVVYEAAYNFFPI